MVFRLQLDETAERILWSVGGLIVMFTVGMLLVKGCGYINGVPQKFAEQETFIRQLGYPVGAKETYRREVNGGSNRSALHVSYEMQLSIEAVRSFYDDLMAERQEWHPLPVKDPEEKEWCTQDDRLSISIYDSKSGTAKASIYISWNDPRHQPEECYR